MAFRCVLHSDRECTGCMDCEVEYVDWCEYDDAPCVGCGGCWDELEEFQTDVH